MLPLFGCKRIHRKLQILLENMAQNNVDKSTRQFAQQIAQHGCEIDSEVLSKHGSEAALP